MRAATGVRLLYCSWVLIAAVAGLTLGCGTFKDSGAAADAGPGESQDSGGGDGGAMSGPIPRDGGVPSKDADGGGVIGDAGSSLDGSVRVDVATLSRAAAASVRARPPASARGAAASS